MAQAQAAAFDRMAERYDAEFTATALGRVLRARVWSRMATAFRGHERILELGCGTGEDAIWLARAGHHIVAVDASAEMIRVARLKAIAAGCAARIEFHCLPMERLSELDTGPCDGVFSNFGAVNCVADLGGLSRVLTERLVPGAPLLWVVMGRHVPWEWGWFLARGDRQRAFRRLRPGGSLWRGLSIQYPTPSMLARVLEPRFTRVRSSGLGFVLPPSYAAAWLERSPRMLRTLGALESATCRFSAALADHYILEARARAHT